MRLEPKLLSTCRQFESRKTKVVLFLSFKLNTDSFIRSIYYNICVNDRATLIICSVSFSANCRVVRLGDGTEYDCSQWCTSVNYPYNPGYPLNYLWSYGNFSRTFVVETNIVCRGFNPSGGMQRMLIHV